MLRQEQTCRKLFLVRLLRSSGWDGFLLWATDWGIFTWMWEAGWGKGGAGKAMVWRRLASVQSSGQLWVWRALEFVPLKKSGQTVILHSLSLGLDWGGCECATSQIAPVKEGLSSVSSRERSLPQPRTGHSSICYTNQQGFDDSSSMYQGTRAQNPGIQKTGASVFPIKPSSFQSHKTSPESSTWGWHLASFVHKSLWYYNCLFVCLVPNCVWGSVGAQTLCCAVLCCAISQHSA